MGPARSRYWTTRRYWWIRPAILGPAVSLVFAGIPMAWWISTYGDMVAVGMFVLTYLLLLGFVIIMLRRSLLDTNQKVNAKAVRSARAEVDEEHVRRLRALIGKDLAAINEGHRTPVLDVWRLDRRLRDRHPFFGAITSSLLDPGSRELHLRVHVADQAMAASFARTPRELLRDVADFLHLVARDEYLRVLRSHADTVILEVYRMVDDGSFHGAPAPVFSLNARFPELDRYAASTAVSALPGDVRFADGALVEPHRHIMIMESDGTK